MAIFQAFTGAISGTLADQWKDIVTAGYFDEHTVVTPGVLKQPVRGRGNQGTPGVITNGSKIFVPENTAAFVFSQAGIEAIITVPGGYVYQNGQESVFNGSGVGSAIINQLKDRIGYGGQTSEQKHIAFVNLREIRGLKFGTRGPLVYNDVFYGADLEILAFGAYSLKVTDPTVFIRDFVPANIYYYTFDDPKARKQIASEFIQSFTDALNSLSSQYRISQLPSQAEEIAAKMSSGASNVGTWKARFGFEIVQVGIESIEFSPDSKALVRQFNANKMSMTAYDDVSARTSDIAARQKIASGLERGVGDHGFGDGGAGMIFGMSLGQALGGSAQGAIPGQSVPPEAVTPAGPRGVPVGQARQAALPGQGQGAASGGTASALTIDQQVEAVKKLKELLDAGILSQSEFDAKKKEVMGF